PAESPADTPPQRRPETPAGPHLAESSDVTGSETRPTRKVATAKRDRVRDHLLQLIDTAAPGTSLDSERDLAEALGVSRPTVRAALQDLARSGYLVRHQGRGTFTSPRKIDQALTGDSADGGAALAAPSAEGTWTSHVVTFRTSPAGPSRATRFGITADALILRIVRVRLVEGEPIAIERLDVPAALVPNLKPDDLESGNFYHLLRDRHGIMVSDAVQTMEPTVANPEQAELLDIEVYAPLLQVERTTKDTTGRVVEFAHSVYRGDRYRITTRLHLDATSG
ncbi:GntR family transcriptional regulator, partial [Catenulispora rubra]|uniref:GntR family transcriptional regulator n=1 Tax=Catenulispora rubra TaxID=280293 RepID=UPI002B268CE9